MTQKLEVKETRLKHRLDDYITNFIDNWRIVARDVGSYDYKYFLEEGNGFFPTKIAIVQCNVNSHIYEFEMLKENQEYRDKIIEMVNEWMENQEIKATIEFVLPKRKVY